MEEKKTYFENFRDDINNGSFIQKVKYDTGEVVYEVIKTISETERECSGQVSRKVAKLLCKHTGTEIREPERMSSALNYKPAVLTEWYVITYCNQQQAESLFA